MNGIVHFSTGYLAGRALGYREYRFEALYMAVAAYSPDFDAWLSPFSHFFAHGIWTHTLIGVVAMSLVLSVVARGVIAWIRPPEPVSFVRLWGLAFLGGTTHLFLDTFTFYESQVDAIHHMYFWPFWNFSWHINTIFPGTSYTTRVLVEVLYCVMVALFIGGCQWGYRKQNPFRMFVPRGWFSQ